MSTHAHGLLSVSDIARERGCDRTTAWRWLSRLKRQYGAKLIRDEKTRALHIDKHELARVVALDKNSLLRSIADLERRFADIEEQIATINRRLDVVATATSR